MYRLFLFGALTVSCVSSVRVSSQETDTFNAVRQSEVLPEVFLSPAPDEPEITNTLNNSSNNPEDDNQSDTNSEDNETELDSLTILTPEVNKTKDDQNKSPTVLDTQSHDKPLHGISSDEEAEKVVPKLLGKQWETFQTYPIGVSEAQGTIVELNGEQHLIVAGGYLFRTDFEVTKRVYSLNILDANAEWIRRADMPKALTHMAQVGVGPKMFMCGGFLGKHPGPSVNDCFEYDISKDRWLELPSLPHRRAGGGIVYIKETNSLFFAGGSLREAGGCCGIDHDDSYNLILNNLKKGWVQKATFQNPRNHMSAVQVENRYFFVGGQHSGNEETGNQPTLNEYVPDEDRWYELADMPYGVGHLSASTPQWGGGFLVIGGVRDGRKKSDDVLFYDMLNDKWYRVGSYVIGVQTPVCGVFENTIYCTTGAGEENSWTESRKREIGHSS